MIKDLFSAATTTLMACAALQPNPAAAMAAEESAANQFMHQADFDQLAARFEDPARAEWQKPEKTIASLGPLDGKTVADIGAGTGYFSFPISKQAAKVIAIDIDKRFLDYIDAEKTDAENRRKYRDPFDQTGFIGAQAGRSRHGADCGHVSSHRRQDRISQEAQTLSSQRRCARDH